MIDELYHTRSLTAKSPVVQQNNPFASFWMAGFECSDKMNAFGNRVDLLTASGHLELLKEDYRRLDLFNMKTVREGIRWSQVEKRPYQYNWSVVEQMIIAGKQGNMQQLWDICHFGFPDDLTPLHPMFARRFAAVCKAFVTFYRTIEPKQTLIITPINEVSFLSWLGGDARGTVPYCSGHGWHVKYQLMKAYIEGIEAIKTADNNVRILTTEPLVNIVAGKDADDNEIAFAAQLHEEQFQVTDILSGAICPELRGRPEYLDILGYNYYFNNQWCPGVNNEPNIFLKWNCENDSSQAAPLHHLLENAMQRYQRPVVLSETSHPKEDRHLWIDMIANECKYVLQKDLPLWGICWYPVIDRPDWDHLDDWHHSGLWDADASNSLQRELYLPAARALLKAQEGMHYLTKYRI